MEAAGTFLALHDALGVHPAVWVMHLKGENCPFYVSPGACRSEAQSSCSTATSLLSAHLKIIIRGHKDLHNFDAARAICSRMLSGNKKVRTCILSCTGLVWDSKSVLSDLSVVSTRKEHTWKQLKSQAVLKTTSKVAGWTFCLSRSKQTFLKVRRRSSASQKSCRRD